MIPSADPQDWCDGPLRDAARDGVIHVLKTHGYDLPGVADLCAGAALLGYWAAKTGATEPNTPPVGVPLTPETAKLLQSGDLVRVEYDTWSDSAREIWSGLAHVGTKSPTAPAQVRVKTLKGRVGSFRLDEVTFIGRPDADGWITWAGGECPVPPDTMIEVRLRSGGIFGINRGVRAATPRWGHTGAGDIVAFRLKRPDADAPPREAPDAPALDRAKVAADDVRDCLARLKDAVDAAQALGVSSRFSPILRHGGLPQHVTCSQKV